MNGTELTHFMSYVLIPSINELTFSESWDFARRYFPKPMNLAVPQSILSMFSLIVATLCLYHARKKVGIQTKPYNLDHFEVIHGHQGPFRIIERSNKWFTYGQISEKIGIFFLATRWGQIAILIVWGLVGSSLVGAKGFLKSQGAYLESAFGTSTPNHILWSNQINVFTLVLLYDVSFQKAMQKPFHTKKYGSSKWIGG